MGRPVVHFDVIGKDGKKLQTFYAELFEWDIDANNEFGYGNVTREGNVCESDGTGIGGGIGPVPEGHEGHVTFYVEVPDVKAALQKAESLGGKRMMGPDEVMEGVSLGQFGDPEGHLIGALQAVR